MPAESAFALVAVFLFALLVAGGIGVFVGWMLAERVRTRDVLVKVIENQAIANQRLVNAVQVQGNPDQVLERVMAEIDVARVEAAVAGGADFTSAPRAVNPHTVRDAGRAQADRDRLTVPMAD